MKRAALCALTAALVVGCGEEPESTSKNDVDVADANSAIALYCLEKSEGNQPDDGEVEAAVDNLVRIYRDDPEASYESHKGDRTARQVLADAATDLEECGEPEIARELDRALDAGA